MSDNGRVVVRAMTDDDDLGALAADALDPWISVWWRELDEGMDPPLMSWFVAEDDGSPAGYGAALRAPAAADGFGIALVEVLRAHRRRGVGTALVGAVEQALRGAGLPGVLYSWREGDDEGAAAAAAWGLAETNRHRENVLDLTAIDREDFAERSGVPGLLLRTLPPLELVTDAEWLDLYEFFAARMVEAPDSAGGGEAPPFPVFRKTITDPWSLVTAEEDGERVGLTCVARRPGTSDVVNTFFTGVSPQARGRGVATALKCGQALLMADAGMTRLFTQNMDGNEPILAANRTMGFVVAGGYVDVVRDFSAATGAPSASS